MKYYAVATDTVRNEPFGIVVKDGRHSICHGLHAAGHAWADLYNSGGTKTPFEGLPADPDEARQALAAGFAEKLGTIMEEGGFDIVYYPWDQELNGDHWLIGQAVTWLRKHRPDLDVSTSWLGFEVWSACIPGTVIDISDAMETKLRAIHAYGSQELYVDYAHGAVGLGAYRSLLLERGATYGEAFVGRYRKPTEGSSAE